MKKEIIKLEQENARTQIEESRLFDSNLIQEVLKAKYFRELKKCGLKKLDLLNLHVYEYSDKKLQANSNVGTPKTD